MQPRWAFLSTACCFAIVSASCEPETGPTDPKERDACDPNPCEKEGKTHCEVTGGAVVCACDEGLVPDGRGGCSSPDMWSPSVVGTAVNASGADNFTAHVRVVDTSDTPIQGAKLRVGTRALLTDVEGRGGFTELPTGALSRMQISADGYVSAVRQLSIANAGLSELRVALVKEGTLQKIDGTENTVLQAGNIGLRLPARGFVASPGSKRVSGEISARITGFAPSTLPEHAWPGDRHARNAAGEPTLVERWLGGVHAEFEDDEGEAVKLGPGSTAQLSIALPDDIRLAQGDTIGLWALDEASGLWLRESSCRVSIAEKVCVGRVSHFSTWAAGIEWDIYEPGRVGCVNITLDVKLPSTYAVNTQNVHVMECDGEDCSHSVLWNDGQVIHLPADAEREEALCGTTSAQRDVRVAIRVQVEQKPDTPAGEVASGTYLYVTDPVDLESFKERLGAQVLLNQTFEPAGDCQLLCSQVAVTLDEESFEGLSRYADEDGDHYYTPAAPNETLPALLGRADCDDGEPSVHPGAFEPPCGATDFDCDGEVPPEEDVSFRDVSDPWLWNDKLCPADCALRDDAEVPGNLYDENCDGRIEDPDSDGFTYYEAPFDCNESSADAHPGGQEVAGNWVDEDCDGYALDWDGDGYFAWGHEAAALEQLGVDADQHPERFGDCNDSHEYVHPGVPVEDEVGALRRFYRELPSGGYARTEQFCDYFDDDGSANRYLYNLLTDRNCDGYVSDMDGDGWTDPRDKSLGVEAAYDCNDLDPRVLPQDPVVVDAAGTWQCEVPAASQQVDDAICPVRGTMTTGCSPLPIEGQSVLNYCIEVPNRDLAICIYEGWETGNPLKWKPGQAWGPCDVAQDLPACPAGYTCGGQQPYSQELEAYLMEKYTMGEPLKYKGMCFKNCEPER